MKVNDLLPVTVEGIVVTNAVVEHIELGKVRLRIDGVIVEVATRTSLSDTTPEPTGNQVIVSNEYDVVPSPNPEVDSTPPVVEPQAPAEAPSND